MELTPKELFGVLAVIIAFLSYIPYFYGLFKKTIKPHVFSWFIWGLIAAIVFFVLLADGGGPGAWVHGFTALVCFVVVFISYRNGFNDITRTDWISFICALLAIPVWYLTGNPLYAILLVVVIDIFGFYPTFRKGFVKPNEDSVLLFSASTLKFFVSIFAIESYTLVTILSPASLVIMNAALVTMLIYRRKLSE